MYVCMHVYIYSRTNHINSYIDNIQTPVLSKMRSICRPSRTRFIAQARRKLTFQTQNSRFGAVLDFRTLMFMHRRGENELCAQARWFCKTVQNHRACQRKSRVCKIVKNHVQFDSFDRKSETASRGMAVIFALPAPPAAEGQKHRFKPFPGASPGPSRAPPGPLPDGSRTPPGRLSGASRAPPGHRLRTQTPAICPNSSS